MALTEQRLDDIEAAARGEMRGIPYPFASPGDMLVVVNELRKARAEVVRLKEEVRGLKMSLRFGPYAPTGGE